MPTVRFTANLKRFYPHLGPTDLEADTIPEVLEELNRIYPGIRDYIVDEQGELRKHVNIFIGNQMVTDKQNLTDHINDSDDLYIMQALSGG
jgi:molybdopterin converting factor small subunit